MKCSNCGVLLPATGHDNKPLDYDKCPSCGVETPVRTPRFALLIGAVILIAGLSLMRWLG